MPQEQHPYEARLKAARPKKAKGISGFLGAVLGVIGGGFVGGEATAFFLSGSSPLIVLPLAGLGFTVGAIAGGLIGTGLMARRNTGP